jgi:hypothetical protein
MTVPIVSQIFNPVNGVFGTGQLAWFNTSGTWIVPAGIGKCRVRLWGAGGSGNGTNAGGGGGFAMRTIYDLSGITSVAVTVGTAASNTSGGTSSFGSFVSATGGSNSLTPGTGIGGDVNNTGGTGAGTSGAGGGSASFFGNGGAANGGSSTGGAGGGNTATAGTMGGFGFLSTGAIVGAAGGAGVYPTSGIPATFSIDFIGCGGGGAGTIPGINGGGGLGAGGFPGGGTNNGLGGSGLVIVEY